MIISTTKRIANTLAGLGLLMAVACEAGGTSDTSSTNATASGDSTDSNSGSDSQASQSTQDATNGVSTTDNGGSTAGADSTDSGDPVPALDVNLGVAGDFAILAKSGISTVPRSAITGDVGVSPAAATFITGFSLIADASGTFATSDQVVGRVYASDYTPPTPTELTVAIGDMELAFTDAAGRAADVTELGAGEIGGMTLDAGVYKWGTGVLIASDVELTGSATDVWIFQVAQDLTLGNGTSISLSGGALPQHVYWQVAGRVEIGTTAHFEGVVLTQTSATLATGSSINGRLLAQTAVSLDGSTVVAPGQ